MKAQMIPRVLAIGLAAAALAGCTVYQQPYETAAAPYYAPPAYGYAPPVYAAPAPVYAPAYVAPSFGLNFGFWGGHGGHHHHHWH